jgi:tetratricopeptide (TPR) repeat protein
MFAISGDKPNSLKIALRLIQRGKYDAAIRLLLDRKTGAIKGGGRSDLNHAYYLIGDAFYKKRDYIKALLFFRKSYQIDRSDWMAMRAIGGCLHCLRQYESAEIWFQKANEIHFEYENVYNIGNALFDNCNYKKAVETYSIIPVDSYIYEKAKRNIKIAAERMGY